MSQGIWSADAVTENLAQAGFTRHKLLIVNCGTDTSQGWNPCDASGFASANPNAIAAGAVNPITPRGFEGGPHFVESAETPDGSPHTYGFEFCLFLNGIPGASQAEAAEGDYTVTIWALISSSGDPGFIKPFWAAFETTTGVGLLQMFHSFDCNATALRFQIGNLELDPADNNVSIGIAFAEL